MSKTATTKKIDKSESIELNPLNIPKCSIFGALKLNHPACKKCETKFEKRFEACKIESKKKAVKKTVKIKIDKLDCFDATISSDTHKFIMEIFKAPCTMKAIKACTWNTRPNTFYCKFKTLQENGNAFKNKNNKTLSLTAKGRKALETWIEKQKVIESEIKKVASA